MIVSVLLLASSFTQNSSGFEDYEHLYEFGVPGLLKSGHFSHPEFIAVSDDGSLFVSDFGNKRIQKFSNSGEYILDWGSGGRGNGEFFHPSGIAVNENSVFVVDRDLHNVQKFSLDGEFISTWGKKGVSEGKFLFPSGIVTSNGIVYVLDTGNQRIQTFSPDGDFISSFGSSGLGPGQFIGASGIAVDNSGNIYVTDKIDSKIEKFNADGEFIKSFSFHFPEYVFAPETITIGPLGDMFVVNANDGRILHLFQDSNLRLSPVDQLGPYPNSFEKITDMAIGINGELLIVDSPTHKIQLFETEFYEESETSYFVAPKVIRLTSQADQTKPVIIAPAPLVVEAEDILTNIVLENATATDASGIKVIINNAPGAFRLGTTNLVWIAFDNSGHSSDASQRITVKACGNDYRDYNMIMGTSSDDVIQGTDGADLIFGLGGNDIISGGNGNDCLFGGPGNDTISGNNGNDTIRGNSGNDVLNGQSGTDIIYSNHGFDVMDGGSNHDRCYDLDDDQKDLVHNCE